MPSLQSRRFVSTAFFLLAATFIASSAIVIWDFREADWFSILTLESHLFIFFPLFGTLALTAIYLPSAVLVDLYWRFLPSGRQRILIGLIGIFVVAIAASRYLDAPPRSVWEISASTLLSDKGEPLDCAEQHLPNCLRVPVLKALAKLARESGIRYGTTSFARNCITDPLLELPKEMAQERYCFPAGRALKGPECCSVQSAFSRYVTQKYLSEPRSLSAMLNPLFLPLKIAFVLLILMVSASIVTTRNQIDEHFSDFAPHIDRSAIIGSIILLFWVAMDNAHYQALNVLYGSHGDAFRLSVLVVPCVLLSVVLIVSQGRTGFNEIVSQALAVTTAAVAVLRYEDLMGWIQRLLGSGASHLLLGLLSLTMVVGAGVLLWAQNTSPRNSSGSRRQIP